MQTHYWAAGLTNSSKTEGIYLPGSMSWLLLLADVWTSNNARADPEPRPTHVRLATRPRPMPASAHNSIRGQIRSPGASPPQSHQFCPGHVAKRQAGFRRAHPSSVMVLDVVKHMLPKRKLLGASASKRVQSKALEFWERMLPERTRFQYARVSKTHVLRCPGAPLR